MLRVGGVAIRCDGDGGVRSVQRRARSTQQHRQQTPSRRGAARSRGGAARGRSSSDGDGELEAMQDYAANMAAEGEASRVHIPSRSPLRTDHVSKRSCICRAATNQDVSSPL